MDLKLIYTLMTLGLAAGVTDVCRSPTLSGPLVSTKVLNEYLKASHPTVIVIETDRSKDAFTEIYMKGHLPTAQYFDLHACVNSTSLIPNNIPESYCFTKLLRDLGINQDSDIVLYDHTRPPMAAARLWWTFRLFGLIKVRILDGGYNKWVDDGFDVTSGPPPNYPKGNFEAKLVSSLIRDMDDMKMVVATNSSQIVDSRTPEGFSGVKNYSTFSGGHIPGSVNLPFASLFTEAGTFKSKDDLKNLFQAAGVDINQPLIATCRTAITACSLAVAAHIIGLPEVPVYYGSWMEWAQVQTDLIARFVDAV